MSLATMRARSRARGRLPRGGIILCVLLVAAAAAYIFGSNFLDLYTLNREAARLETLKRNLQEQNAILREEMKLLQTPGYIEKLAREQLGLVRPGEVAILIVRPPAPPPPPSPARIQQDNRPALQRLWQAVTRWAR
ncbi:MAG TPA: septum formation initiator family protein [bacterium]|nr:septum formation initiator family protein [bacterium]